MTETDLIFARKRVNKRAKRVFAFLLFVLIFGWGITFQLLSLPRYHFMFDAHRVYGPGPSVRGFRSTVWTMRRDLNEVAHQARNELMPDGFSSQKLDDNVVLRRNGTALEGRMIVVLTSGRAKKPLVTDDDFILRTDGDENWTTVQISKSDFISNLSK